MMRFFSSTQDERADGVDGRAGLQGTRWDFYHVNNKTANPTVLSISLKDDSSL